MKDPVRRDTLLTIIGLSLMVVAFIFVIFLPGKKACAEIKREIADANKSIQEIPLRVAEVESLKKEIRKRQDYLKETDRLMPVDADLHAVIRQVAYLARNSNLDDGPLKPQPSIQHETYRVIPYQLSFTGDFRGIATFLHGLESQDRLFTVEEFDLTSRDESRPGTINGDITFSVYIRRAKVVNYNENDASSRQPRADNRIR